MHRKCIIELPHTFAYVRGLTLLSSPGEKSVDYENRIEQYGTAMLLGGNGENLDNLCGYPLIFTHFLVSSEHLSLSQLIRIRHSFHELR